MKSVLISIQPKWCELIASGKKTVEVRKTRPKIEAPFKCYIYCTKAKNTFDNMWTHSTFNPSDKGNGKVIGEFVCDEICRFSLAWRVKEYIEEAIDGSCLSNNELYDYCKGKREFYTWHISDLVIYDKPKELSKFTSIWTDAGMKCKHKEQRQMVSTGERYFHCFSQNCICEFLKLGRQTDCEGYEPTKEPAALEKPPQSWCYVEEVEILKRM